MKLDRVIEGKHNKQVFRYNNGILYAFDRNWDKEDIQTLVEIANLLSLEGYALKMPIGTHTQRINSVWGQVDKEIKTYNGENGEED